MLLLAGLITFGSCDKNKDDSLSNGNSELVGTWIYSDLKFISYAYYGEVLDEQQLEQVTLQYKEENRSYPGFSAVRFASDGRVYFDGQYGGIYIVDGNTITFVESTLNTAYTYSLSGNELQWSYTFLDDGAVAVMTLFFTRQNS